MRCFSPLGSAEACSHAFTASILSRNSCRQRKGIRRGVRSTSAGRRHCACGFPFRAAEGQRAPPPRMPAQPARRCACACRASLLLLATTSASEPMARPNLGVGGAACMLKQCCPCACTWNDTRQGAWPAAPRPHEHAKRNHGAVDKHLQARLRHNVACTRGGVVGKVGDWTAGVAWPIIGAHACTGTQRAPAAPMDAPIKPTVAKGCDGHHREVNPRHPAVPGGDGRQLLGRQQQLAVGAVPPHLPGGGRRQRQRACTLEVQRQQRPCQGPQAHARHPAHQRCHGVEPCALEAFFDSNEVPAGQCRVRPGGQLPRLSPMRRSPLMPMPSLQRRLQRRQHQPRPVA